jgi:hypothetical protein
MGIYNVEITSNDDDFRKVFIFSSENYYHSEKKQALLFAKISRKTYGISF